MAAARPAQRALLAALCLTCLAVARPAEVAAAETVLLDAPLASRARFAAELASVGLRVRAAKAAASLAALRGQALQAGVRVALWVPPDQRSVRLWATLLPGRARERRLLRGAQESVGALAMRVAEVVYAWVQAPEAPDPKSAPNAGPPDKRAADPAQPARGGARSAVVQPAAAEPARPAAAGSARPAAAEPARPAAAEPAQPTATLPTAATRSLAATRPWSLRAGAALDVSPGGLGLGALARIGVARAWPGLPRLAVGAVADLPVRAQHLSTPEGTTAVTGWSGGVEARWLAVLRGRLQLSTEVGGGVVWTRASGAPKPGFVGATASALSALAWARLAFNIAAVGPLSLRLEGDALWATPRPEVVNSGVPRAAWGQPAVRVAACVEVSL